MEENIIIHPESKNIIQESYVWAILGWRGGGKSSIMAKIAETDFNNGKKIVSNFWLSFDHIEMTLEEIIKLPEELQNATVLLDELQVGAGSRNSLSKKNKEMNKFITQLRKRNIVLYFGTQNFKFVDTDIRSQTDYILHTEAVDKVDKDNHKFSVIIVDRHDHRDSVYGTVINTFIWDATELYERNIFNTNEIINFGKE